MGVLETGNYLLILGGLALIALGPYIVYRTVVGVRQKRKEHPNESIHPISNGINILIGIVCLWAGILFVLNNLRGNPFSVIL